MDKKQIAVAAVVLIVVVAALGAAVVMLDKNDSPKDVVVTDMLGREVNVGADVGDVVCLSASSVRLVSYFGEDAVDKIVGIDSYDAKNIAASNYYKATYRIAYDIESITCVGDASNYKDIIATGADVIITSMTSVDDVNTLQTNTGIPTVAVAAAGDIDVNEPKFEEDIKLVGKVLGMDSRADELLNGIQDVLNELSSFKSESTTTADCYIGGMFYMMKGDLYMTTGQYLPLNLTNGVNVMPDKNNGNPYTASKKDLMETGADYIFVDVMTYDSSHSIYETDKADLATQVDAVADGEVYSTLVYKFYGTNWETELMNAYYIGSVLDPAVYDFDIGEKANEVLSLFYPGSDISYDKVLEYQGPGYSHLTDW